MTRLSRQLVFLIPGICFSALAGCARKTEPGKTPAEVMLADTTAKVESREAEVAAHDGLDRPVHLTAVPKRIITIGPAATETIFALDAGASLVGRDSGSDYPTARFPRGVNGLAIVGDYTGPNTEKAVALHPDLVIVQGETFDKARADTWQRQIGAPVAVLRGETIREVVQDMMRIGAWLKRRQEARHVVAPIMAQLNLARLLAARPTGQKPNSRPTAFLEVAHEPQLYSAGKGTRIDDILTTAGFGNAAADLPGYKAVNIEQLIARNPRCYIAMDIKHDPAGTRRELQQNPTLRKLPCVREGRILVMNPDHVMRPGPRLGLGMQALAAYAGQFKPALKPGHAEQAAQLRN